MKVLFMGTPEFAVPTLKILTESHQVTAVVTQPDRPKGRGKKLQPSPIKQFALENNLPVLQPEKIKAPEAVELLKNYEADVFVVVAYGQILSETLLNMPKLGCINVHGSLLPKYRGPAPIEWSIINGEHETGVTIMHMEKGLDTGDMILKKVLPILPEDNGQTIHDSMSLAGAKALAEALDLIKSGKAAREKQDNSQATYAPMLTTETGCIDWAKSSYQITNLIRGLIRQRLAYTVYNGTILKILEAENADGYEEVMAPPGQIIDNISKKGIVVKTYDGAVLITKIQPQGKNPMAVPDYLRGNDISIGATVGHA